ncbi:MAG: sugar ABC transporter permease [Nocardiopsaceae bacterium]|jgi:N,N'-diacetylchitobiose transport system permease protein|nr:sugar ABC transporter permease [Nocardiopsaceae bacterium]
MAEYVWRRERPLRGTTPRRTSVAAFVRRHKLAPYLLLAPGLAGIAVVLLWPLLQVALYAFQNYGLPQITGAEPVQWVGFGNFSTTFADSEFWLSLRNTVLFAAVVVPLTLITGTLVGLLLHRLGRKMAAFVSTSALLAWATPPVAASVLFYWLFIPDGGLVDWILSKLPNWLVGNTDWAGFNWTTSGALPVYTVMTIVVVWQSFPFIAVTVLAGLKTVPAELYEAARVDGATPFRVFWRITYPLLKPIFLVLLLLSVIWDFNVFAQSYLLTGYPGNRDEFNLSLYIYNKAFQFPPSYGLGGALALIFTLILLVVTVGYVRASVRQGALT